MSTALRASPASRPSTRCLLTIVAAGLFAGCLDESESTSTIADDESQGARRPFGASPTILYLNFDGATITKVGSYNDATKNASFIGGGTIPPFGGTQSDRTKIVSLMKQLYADFNIQIVTTRPPSGDYHMAVIGGQPADIGTSPTSGVSPMDCGNAGKRDISFVFSARMWATSTTMFAERVSETTAHETGHSFGLPHSGDGCDLMSSPFDLPCSGWWKKFLNKNMTAVDGSCGMSTTNSYQLLLKALGPVSTTPPDPDQGAPPKPDRGTPRPDSRPPTQRDTGPSPKLDSGPQTEPQPGAFGAACQAGQDCASGLCALDGASQVRFCTQLCSDSVACPGGAPCKPVDVTRSVCGRGTAQSELEPEPASELSGGCALSGSSGSPLARPLTLLLALLALALFASRRTR